MKRLLIYTAATLLCLACQTNKHKAAMSPEEAAAYNRAETLLDAITSHQTPALSFHYDESDSKSVLSSARHSIKRHIDEQGWSVKRATYRAKNGIEYTIEGRIAPEYPVVEWVCYIENKGSDTTAIFSDILAADLAVAFAGEENYNYRFRYSLGSHDGFDDFALKDSIVTPNQSKVSFGARAGWATASYLPFFNIDRGQEEGIIASVGWAGQWKADFTTEGNTLRIEAGLEKTHLRLYPGEKIRTPLMMMLFWQGDRQKAHNTLRRYIVKYSSPKPNGKDLKVPISFPSWGGATTAHHLQNIAKIKELNVGYDNYWIDAGWFGGPHPTLPYQDFDDEDWYGNVGNWEVNTISHPDGLRPISDAAHEADMKFLLWFEPERAVDGTPVAQEHPEWLLRLPDEATRPKVGKWPRVENCLLNLGNEEAFEWVVETLSKRITEIGIDIFRNDNCTGPLRYWANADAADRVGMTEIRYITNFYRLWDTLLERFPHLMIDNCAGGGHRLELEMLRRSVALHCTDYTCHAWADPVGCQLHAFSIMHWIPYSNTGTAIKPYDAYSFRSNMNAGLNFNFLPRDERGNYLEAPEDYPWEWFGEMMRQHAQVKDYFNGDYYPLTKFSLKKDAWCAYQLYKPEQGKGFIMAFRREECRRPRLLAFLGGIDDNGVYRFTNLDTGQTKEIIGLELNSFGYTISLGEPRSSALITIERVGTIDNSGIPEL